MEENTKYLDNCDYSREYSGSQMPKRVSHDLEENWEENKIKNDIQTSRSITTYLYSIKPNLYGYSMYEDMATIASRRYRLYLREEERRGKYTSWLRNIIAAILWLVRLMSNCLKKPGIQKKYIVEKITVE